MSTVNPDEERASKHARLYVEDHVFDLGEITGRSPEALLCALADRLEELADTLRGPKTRPAEPCEGCGAEMVYRRNWPGRYTVESRDDNGEPAILAVHYVASCAMERDAARRLEQEPAQ
jgi:hypothetical protein